MAAILFFAFKKNSSRVPSWHPADFSSGQLRDAESTKKLHNSNKTHFDLIWLFGIWTNFSTPRVVAESHKRDERCRRSSQRPQYPTLYRCLKRRPGCSLRASLYKGSVVRQGKKATHKCSRAEGGFSGPSKI